MKENKPGIFDAVALRRGIGKQHTFGKAGVRIELNFKTRLRQGQSFLGHFIGFKVMRPEFFCYPVDTGAQLFQRKRFPQEFQHLPAEGADQVKFAEFPLEQTLFD